MIYMTSYDSPLGSFFWRNEMKQFSDCGLQGKNIFFLLSKSLLKGTQKHRFYARRGNGLMPILLAKIHLFWICRCARKEVHFSKQSGVCSFKSPMAV